ncbi:MAG: hypothetical protein GX452_13265 [Ignavibacteriales bacterium]|nr:hypothetical protein [Ignavibacteriales bacterium]HPO56906.1 hypothetical protein [Ignavibacteriaceae bacterium]
MGDIVFWAIIRTFILIPVIWLLRNWLDYTFWWTFSFMLIYGVIVHPIVIQYNHFLEKNKKVLDSTLCSTCKHFDKTAVLCLKLDEHPTTHYLPCDGIDWEPISSSED